MKNTIAILSLLSFLIPASAAIYVPPVEQLIPTAEIVVTGKIVQGKDVDGEHRGHIVVTRVLLGEVQQEEKIEVRWKPKPKNLPAGLAHTADYTFAPNTKDESVFVIQPRKDKDKPYRLGWGTQYRSKDEAKIKNLVTNQKPKPKPTGPGG